MFVNLSVLSVRHSERSEESYEIEVALVTGLPEVIKKTPQGSLFDIICRRPNFSCRVYEA